MSNRVKVEIETGPGVAGRDVQIIGHSVLRGAKTRSPPKKGQPKITWITVSGGRVNELWKITKANARKALVEGRKTIFGLDIFQNSVLKEEFDNNSMKTLIEDVERFFKKELSSYHTYFFVSIIRAPLLYSTGHGLIVSELNNQLAQHATTKGQIPCDPGRTLEKIKRTGCRTRQRLIGLTAGVV